MRVEIWTDIICPWCGIGENRLREALAGFEHAGEVEVVHRSFQLDERAPAGSTQTAREMLVERKGLLRGQVDEMVARVEAIAAADGLSPYIVGDNRVGNTSLAHELAAWADELGRGNEMWTKLYSAYFGEGRSVFDVDSLVAIATEAGFGAESAREALTSRRYEKRVLADGREARELGAGGVPFIVIDRRYAIAGAQSADVVRRALETAWKEKAPKPVIETDDGAFCGPDGCA